MPYRSSRRSQPGLASAVTRYGLDEEVRAVEIRATVDEDTHVGQRVDEVATPVVRVEEVSADGVRAEVGDRGDGERLPLSLAGERSLP